MNKIEIENYVYKVHPVYNLYASDGNGNIIHLVRQVPSPGQKHKNGYLFCMVRKHGQNGQKGYIYISGKLRPGPTFLSRKSEGGGLTSLAF